MSEQQYLFVAAPAAHVVASPSSYSGYTGYTQATETAYVQPNYAFQVQEQQTAAPTATYAVPGYQYEVQQQPPAHYAGPSAGSQSQVLTADYTSQAIYSNQGLSVVYGHQQVVAQTPTSNPQQSTALAYANPQQAIQQSSYLHQASHNPGQQQFMGYPQQPQQQQQANNQPLINQYSAQQTPQQQQLASYLPVSLQQTNNLAYAQQPSAMATQSFYGQQQPQSFFNTQQQQVIPQQQPQLQQQQQPQHPQLQHMMPQTNNYQQQQQQTSHQPQQVLYAQPGLPQLPAAVNQFQQQNQQQQQQQQQLPHQQQQQMMFLGGGGSNVSSQGFVRPLTLPGPPTSSSNSNPPFKLPGNQQHSRPQQQQTSHHSSSALHSHTGNQGVEMEVQRIPDTIFIQGLPDETTEQMLVQHFNPAGKFKIDAKSGNPRVILVKDKLTGRPRGEATIGYQENSSVQNAIKMFNNKEFRGRKIRIEVASKRVPVGQQVKRARPGENSLDWVCPNPSCNNQNFSWRNECNRCKVPKPQPGAVPSAGGLKPPIASRLGKQPPQISMPKMNPGLHGNPNLPFNKNPLVPNVFPNPDLRLRHQPPHLNGTLLGNLSNHPMRPRFGGPMGLPGALNGGPVRTGLRGRMDRKMGRPY